MVDTWYWCQTLVAAFDLRRAHGRDRSILRAAGDDWDPYASRDTSIQRTYPERFRSHPRIRIDWTHHSKIIPYYPRSLPETSKWASN